MTDAPLLFASVAVLALVPLVPRGFSPILPFVRLRPIICRATSNVRSFSFSSARCARFFRPLRTLKLVQNALLQNARLQNARLQNAFAATQHLLLH